MAKHFRFVDLFAGIGGTRLGFEAVGGQCVFTSEWNKYAQQTYAANFVEASDHVSIGDIREVDASALPEHEVLLAGFPCQPFSLAGVSKKNSMGRPHGFLDETQGTLFFEVARILKEKRPAIFLLENVRNLVSHDIGNTFRTVLDVLEKDLDYNVSYRIIDSKAWVPQSRKRIYIVGLAKGEPFDFDSLEIPSTPRELKDILHPQNGVEPAEVGYTAGTRARVLDKYTLTEGTWRYLQEHAAKHRAKGNGFGFGLVGPSDVSRTLSSRYYKDGSEILLKQPRRHAPRRLTPRECARLMGFPDSFKIPVSDSQAYRQFGNSVVVPAITEIAKQLTKKI